MSISRIIPVLLLAGLAWAQEPDSGIQVDIPSEVPLHLVNTGIGGINTTSRGGAIVIDLATSIHFRNNSRVRLKGIALQVSSFGVAPGGKASVSVPSLDVDPGQEFPVRLDLRLLQPNALGGKAKVLVQVDGVLFEDLNFVGPNRLSSRRQLVAWEMEARRDRQNLKAVYAKQGEEGIRRTLLSVLSRENARPKLDVKLARSAATLNSPKGIDIAFLDDRESPVEAIRGKALGEGNQLRIPEVVLNNRNDKEIRWVELLLLVKDQEGKEYSAGLLPANLSLKAKSLGTLQPTVGIQLSSLQGTPINVQSLTALVQQVEYSSGEVWLAPSRLRESDRLRAVLPPTLEEQRLAELFRRKGFPAVLDAIQK